MENLGIISKILPEEVLREYFGVSHCGGTLILNFGTVQADCAEVEEFSGKNIRDSFRRSDSTNLSRIPERFVEFLKFLDMVLPGHVEVSLSPYDEERAWMGVTLHLKSNSQIIRMRVHKAFSF